MKRLKILHTRPVKWLYTITQKISFPGDKDLSIYAVLEFFVRSFNKKDIQMRTSALSFSFFLSLFPTAIFFFTLIAYMPIQQDKDKILLFIAQLIPSNAYETIRETLDDILNNQHGNLLSIGFFSALFFSTNGFHSLMNSLNKYSHTKDNRPYWKQRMVAIGLAFFVSALIFVSVLLLTVGGIVIEWIDEQGLIPKGGAAFSLNVLNYVVVAGICLAIISAIFYYAPAKARKFKLFSPGAVFTCIVILITTTGFSYYVNNFNMYNKVYGSIGVLIVIMMLIYINTYILLMGYELNVSIEMARDQKKKFKDYQQRSNRIIYLEDTLKDNSL